MASYQANYYFRQGRKDSSPGILVIEKKWEFIINRSNKQMTTADIEEQKVFSVMLKLLS